MSVFLNRHQSAILPFFERIFFGKPVSPFPDQLYVFADFGLCAEDRCRLEGPVIIDRDDRKLTSVTFARSPADVSILVAHMGDTTLSRSKRGS